jgi:tripartite-type tricarboxylate transporter receptor subunit TctC
MGFPARAERWYDLPDVPTMIELGYKDFLSDSFHGILAPAATPQDVVGRLAEASLEILRQPAFHEQLRSLGFEVIGNGPDGLRKRIEIELPHYRELVARAPPQERPGDGSVTTGSMIWFGDEYP